MAFEIVKIAGTKILAFVRILIAAKHGGNASRDRLISALTRTQEVMMLLQVSRLPRNSSDQSLVTVTFLILFNVLEK